MADGGVHLENPEQKKRPRKRVSLLETNVTTGFVDFLRERAVVGLAVGFVIGSQAQTVVKQLVSSFIDPAFKLLFGQNLSSRSFVLNLHHRHAQFGWGVFVYDLLDFLFLLIIIYLIIKIFKLDRLEKSDR